MKLPVLLPGNLLAYVVLLLIAAYYLGTQRPAASTSRSTKGLLGFLKVLLLVCVGCIAIAALVVSAANPANHRMSEPVSIAYAPSTEPKGDSAVALRQLEAKFMKAAAERGSAGYMSYYADDAVELPNGAPILEGKENIAKTMGFLDDKDNHLTWTPVGADISASGDLGYTYGNYEFRAKDKDGKPIIEHGKYTSIWKKQKDGKWKLVLDMGNATAEAAK